MMEAPTGLLAMEFDGQSERRFRKLAEAIPQMVWTSRADGFCDFVNRRFLDYTGLPADRVLGVRWQESIHPDDRDRCLLRWQEAVERGGIFELEFRIRGRDGSDRWFLGRAEPMVDEGGSPSRWFGTATDIHDRVESARIGRDRDRLTRRVLDNLFAFVAVLEPDGRLVDANEAPLRASGLKVEDLQGRSFWDCPWWSYSEGVRSRIREACDRAASGEAVRFDVEAIMLGDSRKTLDLQISPMRDDSGRITHLIPSAVDITDRVRLEADRRRLAQLVEHSHDFIGLADLDGTITYVNAGGRRMIGLDPDDDPAGPKLSDAIDPRLRDRFRDEFFPAIRDQGRWQGEVRLRHLRTGEPIDISRSTFLIRDPGTGEPVGLGTVSRDVTRENRVRDELREKLRFISEFTALMPGGLYLYDLAARRTLYLNRQSVPELLGGDSGADVDLDAFIARLIHPEDVSRVQHHLDRLPCLPDGQTAVVEYRLRQLDGSWRWYQSLDAAFRREADGRVREVIGVATDITDRKRTEQALQASEEQLRLAFEVARLGVIALDFETDEAIPDGTAAGLFGLEPGVPVPLVVVLDRFHPDDRPEIDQEIARAMDPTGEVGVSMEQRVVLPDGSTRWLSVRHRIAFDTNADRPRPSCGVLAAVDITERKRAEQALRESHRWFKRMADSAPAVLWITEPDGSCSFLSRGWSEYTGQTEARGLGLGWLDAVHPDDRAETRRTFLDALGRREPFQLDFRVRNARGEDRWVTDLGHPWFDDDGRFLGYIGSVIDVTQRKEAEQQAAEARTLAEAANRAKSEFLANMSHEIRTPMTAILGYADILALQTTDPDDLQCVETIRRNGQHLIELINDILDLSKIEAGRLEVERHRFEPDRLVAEVGSLMEVRAREKGLRLEVEFSGPMPETIRSDPTRVRQVLVNLVGNAIKFTESGSVWIVVGMDPEPGPPRLRFEVIDTGIGISPEQSDRLFRPFSQGDSSMTRLYGGTGLGLVICRRLVELLGGSISVESAEGQGSRFAFTVETGPMDGVPMVEPLDGPQAPADPVENGPPRRLDCLVLVVDDRPDIRSLARMFLEDAGARVETADDGQSAIDTVLKLELAGAPVDVVVMDMQMPRLDGYSAVARLREAGFSRPVVALTASAMRGDRERCLQAGCTEYLPKPIDRRRLVETVGRLAGEAPRPSSPSPPTPAVEPESPESPAGFRVLVVDDHEDICRVTARLLKFSGHEPRTAPDGRTALELAAEFRPEVVLLDLGLPDLDGLELAPRLREIDGLDHATIIAVTGRGHPEDREHVLASGFDHMVIKPVDLDNLLALFPSTTAPPPSG